MYMLLKRHKTEPTGVFYNSPASAEDVDSRVHALLRLYFCWRHQVTRVNCRARQSGVPGTAIGHPVVYESDTAPDLDAALVQLEVQARKESRG
jgi:hypothetical protein